ncbi:MAG: prephenate dehydrogenase/arogenate dehydrogenase family protein [Elusimicrobia bacterium]|nr:prephenate dehydrogenase/arogenate dehydrogenase family protein [Elusimicrobiota bacterium]
MSVGIIGFGRLGRLLTRYFAADVSIRVYDPKASPRDIRALGAAPATLEEACRQTVVIPCVPIAAFEGVIRRIRGLIPPGALVIDVCSVKEHPVRVMKRLLPRGVDILATHPNFGPDSAAQSLRGHKLVVCKVRLPAARYRKIKRLLEGKGLRLVEMTPAAHDRKSAASLVLTHFVGRALIGYGAKTTGVDTEGYTRLLRILQTVQNDSWRLFQDMNSYNAYAAPMRRRFLKTMRAIDARVSR